MQDPLLELQDVSKRYSRTQALSHFDLELFGGQVTAFLGANGAGKSTAVRIISGAEPPDSGIIKLAGREFEAQSVRHTQRFGVGVVRQELDLIPELTVGENIFLGEHSRFTSRGLLNRRKMYRQTQPLLDWLGLGVAPDEPLRRLGRGSQQLVAVARALRDASRVLVLDEPTSSLTPFETEILFQVIGELKASGLAILYITHHLDEVAIVGDRVAVIRDGRNVANLESPPYEPDSLAELMVPGATLEAAEHVPDADPNRELLRMDEVRINRAKGFSLHLSRGEIVGLFGSVGSGRSDIGRSLIGLEKISEGRIVLGGEHWFPRDPYGAFRGGVAYVPPDRNEEGIVERQSVKYNMVMRSWPRLKTYGLVDPRKVTRLAERFKRELDIKVADMRSDISHLSGGNQQKVVIARSLGRSLRLMVFDEPSRGVDVGARTDIHRQIVDLASEGCGVILISNDIDELAKCCHRVIVVRDGGAIAELPRGEITERDLMTAAAASE